MKTIRLIDSTPLYYDGVFGVYKFRNQNGNLLLLTWEEAIKLITEGYKYIPFF